MPKTCGWNMPKNRVDAESPAEYVRTALNPDTSVIPVLSRRMLRLYHFSL